MAGLTCVYCHTENVAGEQLCQGCFRRLPSEQVAALPADHALSLGQAGPGPPFEAPPVCPHCGEEVPDPDNRVCVGCHRSLGAVEPLRLCFPAGAVTIAPTDVIRLGRDPASSPVAALFADRGNVSRLHATVGIDDNGAWVRDERSLNGTFVNDVPVPPGTRIGLAHGDTLRLAADVCASVEVGGVAPG